MSHYKPSPAYKDSGGGVDWGDAGGVESETAEVCRFLQRWDTL